MTINRFGWLWVLEHATTINKASRFFAYARGFDPEDFHQELVIRLARRAPDYDPDKGSVSTWVGYQCKAVCSSFRDKREKVSREAPPDQLNYTPHPTAEKEIENRSSVGMVRRRLSGEDFSIVVAKAFSFTDEECKSRLGISRWGTSRKASLIFQTLK